MEIRIYRGLSAFSQGKYFFCSKVENVDCFEPNKALEVFRSIYGADICVVFIYA